MLSAATSVSPAPETSVTRRATLGKQATVWPLVTSCTPNWLRLTTMARTPDSALISAAAASMAVWSCGTDRPSAAETSWRLGAMTEAPR